MHLTAGSGIHETIRTLFGSTEGQHAQEGLLLAYEEDIRGYSLDPCANPLAQKGSRSGVGGGPSGHMRSDHGQQIPALRAPSPISPVRRPPNQYRARITRAQISVAPVTELSLALLVTGYSTVAVHLLCFIRDSH